MSTNTSTRTLAVPRPSARVSNPALRGVRESLHALARVPPGLTRAVTQWTVGIKPTWTVAEVRQAIRQHNEGDFSLSARLWDSMGEDDAIPALMDKRINRLLMEEFRLDPIEGPKGRRKSAALVKRFGGDWWECYPESELYDFMYWYHGLGVALAVQDWTLGKDEWMPHLRVLHPQYLRYDQYLQKWLYNAREGLLEVTPGDGRWVLFTDGQRGWMHGFVRSLAIDWIAKQLSIRDQNRYNERHGMPIIKGFAPMFADDEDRDQFAEDLQDIGSEAVAMLPTHMNDKGAQFDLQLMEATDKSWETFGATVERIDRKFTIRIVGANLGTEVNDTGAYAASESHNEVLRELAHADGQKLSTTLRKQGLYYVCAVNEPSVELEIVPWPRWSTEAIGDATEIAGGQKMFGEAVKSVQDALGSAHQLENIAELGERHGLKIAVRPPEVQLPVPTEKGTVGAQIDAVMKVVDAINAKQIPREVGVNILVTVFGMTAEEADKLLGPIGGGFVPAPIVDPNAPPPDPNAPTDPAPAPEPEEGDDDEGDDEDEEEDDETGEDDPELDEDDGDEADDDDEGD